MKKEKFTIDDIVFFKNSNNVVKAKVEYMTYSKTGEVNYYIVGFVDSFSENNLFSTLNEAFGNESLKNQLF